MGPIAFAILALRDAQQAMRDHDMVMVDECRICRRMIDKESQHASDCAYSVADRAVSSLQVFQKLIAN